MKKTVFVAAFFVAAISAGMTAAQPAAVTVSVGPDLTEKVDEFGRRDLDQQIDRLTQVVVRELARDPAFDGARVELTLVRLKANRPTWEQLRRRPGLDPIRSRSIGGAEIEGRVILADGRTTPVGHRWFSSNLRDVWGFGTWTDAERAYRGLAAKLARGV